MKQIQIEGLNKEPEVVVLRMNIGGHCDFCQEKVSKGEAVVGSLKIDRPVIERIRVAEVDWFSSKKVLMNDEDYKYNFLGQKVIVNYDYKNIVKDYHFRDVIIEGKSKTEELEPMICKNCIKSLAKLIK